jgi:hypothetical protein
MGRPPSGSIGPIDLIAPIDLPMAAEENSRIMSLAMAMENDV